MCKGYGIEGKSGKKGKNKNMWETGERRNTGKKNRNKN